MHGVFCAVSGMAPALDPSWGRLKTSHHPHQLFFRDLQAGLRVLHCKNQVACMQIPAPCLGLLAVHAVLHSCLFGHVFVVEGRTEILEIREYLQGIAFVDNFPTSSFFDSCSSPMPLFRRLVSRSIDTTSGQTGLWVIASISAGTRYRR